MKLNLTRPLIIFDLESTGLDVATARIIQISYIKAFPDGTEKRVNLFVNPQMPIPQEVQELTHITNEMVKDAPTFKALAPQLAEDFKDCDFAGYNSANYDVPLLVEEFLRAGLDFDFRKAHHIDVCNVFKLMERRNLAAAYKFYCGRRMEDDFQAHLADQDTEATWRVLQAQLDMYSPERQDEPERVLPNDVKDIADFSQPRKIVDFAGRLAYDDNDNIIVNFGKHKGKRIQDVLIADTGYVNWVLQGEFTQDTKRWFQKLKLQYATRR